MKMSNGSTKQLEGMHRAAEVEQSLPLETGTVSVTDSVMRQRIRYIDAVQRHLCGDWGDVSTVRQSFNDKAVLDGGTLVSRFTTGKGERILVVTRTHQSRTTVMLPCEYLARRRFEGGMS